MLAPTEHAHLAPTSGSSRAMRVSCAYGVGLFSSEEWSAAALKFVVRCCWLCWLCCELSISTTACWLRSAVCGVGRAGGRSG